MNFRNFPKHIQDEIRLLTTDEEFQHRFATDKVLDEIDAMKTNMADEYKSLQLVLGNNIKINETVFKPITPAVWCFLWVIDSPFVNYTKKINNLDVDIFFYILEYGIGDGDTVRIVSEAMGFTSNVLQITYPEGLGIITSLIRISFRPLNLFPKMNTNGRCVFDAEWLTSLIVKVYQVTGYSPEYIMNDMSMTAACYYFAQFKKMNGDTQIYKRTDEEILILEDRRAGEMVIDRLIEKGVLPAEEREKWLKEIQTRPEKKK